MRRGLTYEQQDRIWRAEDRKYEEDRYAKEKKKVLVTTFAKGYDYDVHDGRLCTSGVGQGWSGHDEVVEVLRERHPECFDGSVFRCWYDSWYVFYDNGGIPATIDLSHCQLRDVIMSADNQDQILILSGEADFHWKEGLVQVKPILSYRKQPGNYLWIPKDKVIEDLCKLWGLPPGSKFATLYTSSGHRCNYELGINVHRWSAPAKVPLDRTGRVTWRDEDCFGRGTPKALITGLLTDEASKGEPRTYRRLFWWPTGFKNGHHIFGP